MGWLSTAVGALATAAFGPVGGAVAGAVVGAGEQRYAEKKQNQAIDAANAKALEREQTQFERLRDSAVRAGFNPLTVLRSGMFQNANLLARQPETWKASLFAGVANAAINAPQLRFDAEMRDLERREREANITYTGALASQAMRGTGFNPRQELPPLTSANAFDAVPVYDPRGLPVEIPLSLAHSLNLLPHMMIGAEVFEQMLGEVSTEVYGGLVAVDTAGGSTFMREGHSGQKFGTASSMGTISREVLDSLTRGGFHPDYVQPIAP